MTDAQNVCDRVRARMPVSVAYWTLRWRRDWHQDIAVRRDVVQPPVLTCDEGVMISVVHRGGLGWAATSDLSEDGIARAVTHALELAQQVAACSVIDAEHLVAKSQGASDPVAWHAQSTSAVSKAMQPWRGVRVRECIEPLRAASAKLHRDQRIVDWHAGLWVTDSEQYFFTSHGELIVQHASYVLPSLSASANVKSETQTRTHAGRNGGMQAGAEVLSQLDLVTHAERIADEALMLVTAPECPAGVMDLVLAPDQMVLQIHESIGHPLELDRILGDERNYAGRSFVDLSMFGAYQYGSKLLNITFDPTVPNEYASYAFDDEGQPATRQYIIRDGILQRPLGSRLSQARARMTHPHIEGVANARACHWSRVPIDRMANLNLEAGDTSFDAMIGAIDNGILMKTNTSWSIDDSRNKFQFGCEWGQLIEHGKLTQVVKNPNYRGISAHFWRNLMAVGSPETRHVLGVSNCGKGEPNQAVRVGHASPACHFANVAVFGGGA